MDRRLRPAPHLSSNRSAVLERRDYNGAGLVGRLALERLLPRRDVHQRKIPVGGFSGVPAAAPFTDRHLTEWVSRDKREENRMAFLSSP